jgi:hypothetical protein
VVVVLAPLAPCVIWVLGLLAGDVMVDRSSGRERLRPLSVSWAAALGREPGTLRELAGSLVSISQLAGLRRRSGMGCGQPSTGSSAAGPSSRRVWKERRASLRAIVSEARVCERPRRLRRR